MSTSEKAMAAAEQQGPKQHYGQAGKAADGRVEAKADWPRDACPCRA